jgi:hypothetical protein
MAVNSENCLVCPKVPTWHDRSVHEEDTQRALDRAVRELERHVARGGWDGPVRLFALLRTAEAIARDPALRDQLPPDLVASADADPGHVTSVEQEDLPQVDRIEDLLGEIAWPDAVDGAAIVLERIVVPPEAEADLPADPELAQQRLLEHPAREDVRMAAGVLRTGQSACALRTRRHDDDGAVASGPDLVPGLVAALRTTLAD